jgi:membrane associated rhomboid family serine protease
MSHPLKLLIFATLAISLLSANLPEVFNLLTLSRNGIEHFFLWQLITYIFLEKGPFSLSFFINLAFNMYLLWVFGSLLMERAEARLFFLLYFGAALVGGLFALADPHALLASSTNGVYALLVAWMLLNQHAKLLFFFALPLKAKWLILGLVIVTLVLDLANHSWAAAISLAAACIYSYFFTLTVWKQPGPFSFLRKFEKRFFQFFEKKRVHESYKHSKIYDIKSGEPILDDDQFMDAMLDRISRHGEDSLTGAEKKRMKEISKRK